MANTTPKAVTVAVFAAVGSVFLTGCSANSGTPSTPTPSVSVVSPAATVAVCQPGDLRVRYGTGRAAMGTAYQTVVVRNAGATTCSLHGYPSATVSIGTASAPLPLTRMTHYRFHPRPPAMVRAGGTAYFSLAIPTAANYSAQSCGRLLRPTQLHLWTDSPATALRLPWRFGQVCSKAAPSVTQFRMSPKGL